MRGCNRAAEGMRAQRRAAHTATPSIDGGSTAGIRSRMHTMTFTFRPSCDLFRMDGALGSLRRGAAGESAADWQISAAVCLVVLSCFPCLFSRPSCVPLVHVSLSVSPVRPLRRHGCACSRSVLPLSTVRLCGHRSARIDQGQASNACRASSEPECQCPHLARTGWMSGVTCMARHEHALGRLPLRLRRRFCAWVSSCFLCLYFRPLCVSHCGDSSAHARASLRLSAFLPLSVESGAAIDDAPPAFISSPPSAPVPSDVRVLSPARPPHPHSSATPPTDPASTATAHTRKQRRNCKHDTRNQHEETQHTAHLDAHLSPARRIVRHALDSILALLEWSDFRRAVAVRREWFGALHA